MGFVGAEESIETLTNQTVVLVTATAILRCLRRNSKVWRAQP